MIDSILALVLGNTIEAAIIVVVGLLLGVLISLLYWRGQVNKRESHVNELDGNINDLEDRIKDLEATVEGKNSDLAEMRTRSQEIIHGKEKELESLNNQLKNYENLLDERNREIENLNTQLSQREENIRDLNQQIDEKNTSIDLLNKEAADLDKKNQASVIRAEDAETRVEELENSLEEKRQEISVLEEKNRNSMIRAEGAEARMEELENSMEEKEQEATSLKTRIRAMQDDFTYIAGIGPKVSSVLRLAGINTFAKLASTDVDKIREVLEAENPRLLRLTDPSTWPEQARFASEEDWETLSALQDSLKESRRN